MASASGALGGAGQGAAAGSAFGPWGTAAGAVLGGLAGAFGGESSEDIQPMFASQRKAKSLIEDLFGPGGKRKVKDYLRHPYPVTAGEAAEAGYFGTAPSSELLQLFAMKGGKGRKKALNDYYRNYDPAAEAAKAANSPFMQRVGQTQEDIATNYLPSVRDLVNTGFRTDLAPIIAEEQRRLRQETLPATAERFRTALTGSGFQGQIGQDLEDLAVRLGAYQVNADEAASQRRYGAITSGAAGNALQLPMNLELGANLIQGSAGQRARGRYESVRPGGRLLAALGQLGQIETQGGFVQNGEGSGIGDLFGTIASIPGLLNGIGNQGSIGPNTSNSNPMSGNTSAFTNTNPFAFEGIV